MSKTTDELFQTLSGLWEDFAKNHAEPTKVSSTRARKALGEIKKLVTEYRKSSVEESKNQ